jgi:hypothetical protein
MNCKNEFKTIFYPDCHGSSTQRFCPNFGRNSERSPDTNRLFSGIVQTPAPKSGIVVS